MRALAVAAARLLEALAVLFVLASVVFFALRIVPGDPAALVLGDQASPLELARLRTKLHLDEPLTAQYLRFLRGLATFDLGESLRHPGQAALVRVGQALAPTGALAGVAVTLGALAGVGLALLGAGPWLGERRRWVERGLVAVASMPLLSFAPVVTYALSARLRLLPLPGDPDAGLSGLLFASTLLAVPLAAQVGRTGRAALAEVASMPFLSVARAKGATIPRVWLVHALPVASGPIVTVVATQLGALLGGAVVLERLFERWGLGTLILEAYASRDFPVLEGAVVASGAIFVLVQAVAAAAHAALDARVTA